MREGSPNPFSPGNRTVILSKAKDLCTRWQRHRSRRGSELKSLFQNILAVSPCGSRFYPESGRYPLPKLLRINTLAKRTKKYQEGGRAIRESLGTDATPRSFIPRIVFQELACRHREIKSCPASLRCFRPFLLAAVEQGLAVFRQDPASFHQVVDRVLVPSHIVIAIPAMKSEENSTSPFFRFTAWLRSTMRWLCGLATGSEKLTRPVMRSYDPASPNGLPLRTSVREAISTRTTRAVSGKAIRSRISKSGGTRTRSCMRGRIARLPRGSLPGRCTIPRTRRVQRIESRSISRGG